MQTVVSKILVYCFLKSFAHEIDSWAIYDTTIGIFKSLKNVGFIDQLLKREVEFRIRVVFFLLLGFRLVDNYIDYILKKATEVKLEAYYVRLVVVWALYMGENDYNRMQLYDRYLQSEQKYFDVWDYEECRFQHGRLWWNSFLQLLNQTIRHYKLFEIVQKQKV